MALPTQISGVKLPTHNVSVGPVYPGPFLSSGGAVYLIAESDSTAGDLLAMKASDPVDGSFSEQDSANRPSLGFELAMWVDQVGDELHVATQHIDTSGMTNVGPVRYHVFDMSSDSWTTVSEVVADPSETKGKGVSIAIRSNDERVIMYRGASESVMGSAYKRVDYAIWTSLVGWSPGHAIDSGGEANWSPGVAVLGASDRVHFLLHDSTNSDDYHRSLSSGGSLDTLSSYRSTSTTAGPAGTFESGGSIEVRALNNAQEIVEFTSEADPTITLTTGAADNLPMQLYLLLVDGTDRHIIYIQLDFFGGGNPIYRDENTGSGWGTDVEVESDPSTRLSANIYNRSGTELAYVRTKESDSTVWYNEVVLAAAGQTITVGQASETDTGTSVGSLKEMSVAQATETDVGLAAGSQKSLAVGQATETDSGFAVTASKGVSVGVAQASETDAAFAAGSSKALTVAQAAETSQGFGVSWTKAFQVSQAVETDQAFGVTVTLVGVASTYKSIRAKFHKAGYAP